MVMLLAGLAAIPDELYEASSIDGCGAAGQFRYVTLPSLRGVLATVALLDFIWTFRAFDLVFVMTGGGPINSSQVLATSIYFDAFQKFQFGYCVGRGGGDARPAHGRLDRLSPAGGAAVTAVAGPGGAGDRARPARAVGRAAVYVLLVLATAVTLFPIAWMATVSIRPNVEVMKIPPQWIPSVVTWQAYAQVLGSARYLRTFANSYAIALTVTFLSLAVGALAAYPLSRFRFRGQRLVMTFLIVTQMFPLVLLCIPYFRVMVRLGLYDTLTSLVLVYTTFTLPFCILMLRSVLHRGAARARGGRDGGRVLAPRRRSSASSCRSRARPWSARGSTRSSWRGTSFSSRSS